MHVLWTTKPHSGVPAAQYTNHALCLVQCARAVDSDKYDDDGGERVEKHDSKDVDKDDSAQEYDAEGDSPRNNKENNGKPNDDDSECAERIEGYKDEEERKKRKLKREIQWHSHDQ